MTASPLRRIMGWRRDKKIYSRTTIVIHVLILILIATGRRVCEVGRRSERKGWCALHNLPTSVSLSVCPSVSVCDLFTIIPISYLRLRKPFQDQFYITLPLHPSTSWQYKQSAYTSLARLALVSCSSLCFPLKPLSRSTQGSNFKEKKRCR